MSPSIAPDAALGLLCERCGAALEFRRGLCVSCYREARRTGTISVHTRRRVGVVIEDVEWLLAAGETHPEAIALRTGYKAKGSLIRALRRAGRRDLIDRMLVRAADAI